MHFVFKKLVLFIVTFVLLSCSGGGNQNPQTDEVSQTDESANTAPSKDKAGENLYLKYCMACHQTDGSGVPGMYPPLINSPMANAENSDEFIRILLNGLKGPIEVHGKKYNNQMPSHNFLSDEELAQIINYVSKSFKNNGKEVTPGDIKALRSK